MYRPSIVPVILSCTKEDDMSCICKFPAKNAKHCQY